MPPLPFFVGVWLVVMSKFSGGLVKMMQADIGLACEELDQRVSISGASNIRCVVSFPTEGRDLSELGFEASADLGVQVIDADFTTVPEMGAEVVFLSRKYVVTSLETDGVAVGRLLSCKRKGSV